MGNARVVPPTAASQPRQEQAEQTKEPDESAILRAHGLSSGGSPQLSGADGLVDARRRGEIFAPGDDRPVQPGTYLFGWPGLRSAKAAMAQWTLDSRRSGR